VQQPGIDAGDFAAWLSQALVRAERAHFPPGYAPPSPLGIAAFALRVYRVFLSPAGAAFDRGACA